MIDFRIAKLREQEEDFDLEAMPQWVNSTIGGGSFISSLTDKQKTKLISSDLWPMSKPSDSLKSQFLDAVDQTIFRVGLAKVGYLDKNRSPSEQQKKLTGIVKNIRAIKKQIATLSGGALTNAAAAYKDAYMVSQPDFHLRLKNDLGSDLSSLLALTWAHLDDLEKTLNAGAKRIKKGKGNRPADYINDGLVANIAADWQKHFNEKPSQNKTCRFDQFIQELSSILEIKITSDCVKRAVKKL